MFHQTLHPAAVRGLAFVLLFCLLPLQALAECPQVSFGADSPKALIDGVRSAAESGDLGSLAVYLSPADRTKAALGLSVGATMLVAFQKMGMDIAEQGASEKDSEAASRVQVLEQRLQGILDQHGVDGFDLATLSQAMEQGPDSMAGLEENLQDVCAVGLIGDLAAFLSEVSERQVGDQLARLTNEEVGPVTVDGDLASATIGDQPFQMHRIDGRWYVDLESTGGAGPSGP